REARAVNLVRHPNIVDIYDFGELPDRRPYFVMELLEGLSVSALLEERGVIPASETLSIVEPVCAALQAAHDVGVIHRDLKASNIFVVRRGSESVIKLLDFGIAKLVQPGAGGRGLTSAGTRLGTPYAMAPEQIRFGPVDARTDVYALGVLLHHLLTGRHPFEA